MPNAKLPAAEHVPLSEVLAASKTYSYEQALRLIEGIDLNDFRNQFGGCATGQQIVEWAASSISKRIRVKADLAQRILKARATAGTSISRAVIATALEAPGPLPATSPAAAKKPTRPMGQSETLTPASFIHETRWYDDNWLLEHFDGFTRQDLATVFGNRASIIGGEFLRYAQVRQRERRPLTVRPSVIAEIEAIRKLAQQRRLDAEAKIRTQAREMLVEFDATAQHAASLEACKAKERELREQYAQALCEIAAAAKAVVAAQFADAESFRLRGAIGQLVRRWPSLFDTAVDPPRLLPIDRIAFSQTAP